MKRIFAAVLLSVLILVLCACGRAVTERSIRDLQDDLQEIEAALTAGETEIALQKSENFLQNWEATHGHLCIFLQHAQLDTLDRIFAVLPYYIETGEHRVAAAECRTAYAAAEHILRTEQVSLENIL